MDKKNLTLFGYTVREATLFFLGALSGLVVAINEQSIWNFILLVMLMFTSMCCGAFYGYQFAASRGIKIETIGVYKVK
jgi:hypothetical protein